MTDAEKIGWVIGFGAGANWEITPIYERKYDMFGNCINGSRSIGPEHEEYQDPVVAFEKHFGEMFLLSSPQKTMKAKPEQPTTLQQCQPSKKGQH